MKRYLMTSWLGISLLSAELLLSPPYVPYNRSLKTESVLVFFHNDCFHAPAKTSLPIKTTLSPPLLDTENLQLLDTPSVSHSIPPSYIENSLYFSPTYTISIDRVALSSMHALTHTKFTHPLRMIKDLSSLSFVVQEASSLNRQNRFIYKNLAELPSLEDLQTVNCSDDFKIDVQVLPKPDKTGYNFALQITPYDQSNLETLPQHVYFILDRSVSIEPHRFETFKQGLTQALNYLNCETSFNIVSFNEKCEKLHSSDLKPTKTSLHRIKRALNKLDQKGKASFRTLLSFIESLKKEALQTKEPYTVIILSNGHFLKNLRYHKDSLYTFFHTPRDNFSIFTAAISDDNNTPMLNLLAKLGRGEFLHSQIHTAFPRKLAVLMKRLQKPLAYDLSITKANPAQKITFYHNPQIAPLLFSDKSYYIYGTAETLEDLCIILQCRSPQKWFNIVKTISLKEASRGKSFLNKELTSKQELDHIINFIFNKDS